MRIKRVKGDTILKEGDTIECRNKRELNTVWLSLASDGYGVFVKTYRDYVENRLTIAYVPRG